MKNKFHRISMICISIFAIAADSLAASKVQCVDTSAASSIRGLELIQCRISNAVRIEIYRGAVSGTSHSTELDQRTVALIRGADKSEVRRQAGIEVQADGGFSQSRLLQPSFNDQIAKREPPTRPTHRHGWSISATYLQYGAQGGALGYPFVCATAMRALGANTVVVAECFSLEAWPPYWRVLDALEKG